MEEHVRTWATAALAVALLVVGAVSATAYAGSARQDAVTALTTLALPGAGVMVLAGLVLRSRRPSFGTAVLVVGAVTAVAAAMDTVVLPLLGLVVLVLTLRDQTRERV